MDWNGVDFWAKTTKEGQPGLSVRDHCLNVGCVAEAMIAALPAPLHPLLPQGGATLAALHDVGKITLGFQAKCPQWLERSGLPKVSHGEVALSVTDQALVSQVFLQKLLNAPEPLAEWAEENRLRVMDELLTIFGPLPTVPPEPRLAPHHSDLWLLAGIITVADWIGSNKAWFSPEHGVTPDAARQQARGALRQIGWPGGRPWQTGFSAAFAYGSGVSFQPNTLQQAVADAAQGGNRF